MWVASGTAIAHAPNVEELRDPVDGGAKIQFDSHGHGYRPHSHRTGFWRHHEPTKDKTDVVAGSNPELSAFEAGRSPQAPSKTTLHRESCLSQDSVKHSWTAAVGHGLAAFGKFVYTPTGFFITIYGLNVVGWGAMVSITL